MATHHIVTIAGSLRKESFSLKIANSLAKLAPASLKLDVMTPEGVSFFNQDLEANPPADWVALVREYPLDVTDTAKRGDWWRTTGRDGRWAMPDWSAVARDVDAVHLTVAAYLATAGRALPVDALELLNPLMPSLVPKNNNEK